MSKPLSRCMGKCRFWNLSMQRSSRVDVGKISWIQSSINQNANHVLMLQWMKNCLKNAGCWVSIWLTRRSFVAQKIPFFVTQHNSASRPKPCGVCLFSLSLLNYHDILSSINLQLSRHQQFFLFHKISLFSLFRRVLPSWQFIKHQINVNITAHAYCSPAEKPSL